MKIYDQFVGLVAEGRSGPMTEQAIRATEARTYLGSDAIAQGLADRVASLDEVIATFAQPPSGASPQRKGGPMTKTTQTEAPQCEASAFSPADLQAAVDVARTEAHAAGVTAGKAEATARIKSILTAPETEGREAQALVLALETEMTAEDAAKVLTASPKASVPTTIAERAAQETELGAETPADHHNRDRSGFPAPQSGSACVDMISQLLGRQFDTAAVRFGDRLAARQGTADGRLADPGPLGNIDRCFDN